MAAACPGRSIKPHDAFLRTDKTARRGFCQFRQFLAWDYLAVIRSRCSLGSPTVWLMLGEVSFGLKYVKAGQHQ